MGTKITVHEAKTNLSELLRRVEAGEEIVISRGDKPIAVLSAYAPQEISARRRKAFGSLTGTFEIPSDDALFSPATEEELEEMFGEASEFFK